MKKYLLLIIVICTFISCGKKGPLFLEPVSEPLEIKNFSARQVEDKMEFSWTFPAELSDKSQLNRELLNKISVYHTTEETDPAKFRKKSSTIIKTELTELKQRGSDYLVYYKFKLSSLNSKRHFFAMTYNYGKRRSPVSNIVTIKTEIPPQRINDLKIKKENKVLKLYWTKPDVSVKNKPVTNISGFTVYRKRNKQKNFRRINKDKVLEEFFQDRDTGHDGKYFYYVTTNISENIESGPSNTVNTSVKDVFPPDAPENLVIFRGDDHFYLTWEKVSEPDVSHYRIYRKALLGKNRDFMLIEDNIKENIYKDRKFLRIKVMYYYAITAVDKKGNESKFSNIALVRY